MSCVDFGCGKSFASNMSWSSRVACVLGGAINEFDTLSSALETIQVDTGTVSNFASFLNRFSMGRPDAEAGNIILPSEIFSAMVLRL